MKKRIQKFLAERTARREQELGRRAEEILQEWRQVATCTEPADRETTERAIVRLYEGLGLSPPRFVWAKSPYEALLHLCGIMESYKPRRRLLGYRFDRLSWRSYGYDNEHFGRLFQDLNRLVRSSVVLLERALEDDLREKLGVQKWEWFIDTCLNTFASSQGIGEYCKGQYEVEWIAPWRFALCYLGTEGPPLHEAWELECWSSLTRSCGWWWPLWRVVVVSDRPCQLHLKEGRLHRDGGPAVQFRDGWGLWALHGVQVPREIAETPWKELDPRRLVQERNAEVRREMVRKIGIERVCQGLDARCVDRQGEYELLLLDLGDGQRRPYLKMRNPSIGVYHIEGVPPDIERVAQALAWRNGTDEEPVAIT
jgi:hypothetical protein